jgi:fatty acid elongase 3
MMDSKDIPRMKKRYLSGAGILAYMLVSKRGQEHLEALVSDSLTRPFKEFEYESGVTWLSAWHWPVILCTFYLISVYSLRNYMRDKPKWDLYWIRVFHNAFLSFASFVMVLGVIKEVYHLYTHYGIESLICDESRRQSEGNMFFWYYVFFLSKFYEFIDTYILCVRKKPITFLHCFHHFITAFLCWVGLYSGMSPQWIVIGMNGSVHIHVLLLPCIYTRI